MFENESIVRKTISFTKKQIDFLDKYYNNINLAVRKLVDKEIESEKNNNKVKRIENFNRGFVFIALGLIFFLFSYITIDYSVSLFSIFIGIIFCTYGVIMGVMIR